MSPQDESGKLSPRGGTDSLASYMPKSTLVETAEQSSQEPEFTAAVLLSGAFKYSLVESHLWHDRFVRLGKFQVGPRLCEHPLRLP